MLQRIYTCSINTIREGFEYERRAKPQSTGQRAFGVFLLRTDSTVPRQKTRGIYTVIGPDR